MFNTNFAGLLGIPTYRSSGQYPSNINSGNFTVPTIAERPNTTGFNNPLFFESFLNTVNQSDAFAPVTKNTFGTPLNKKAPFNAGSFYGPTPSVNSQIPELNPLGQNLAMFRTILKEQGKIQEKQQADWIKAYPGLMRAQQEIQEEYASRAADKKFKREMLMGGANALLGGLQTYIQGGDPSILMYKAESPMRIAGSLMQGYRAGLG